MSCAESTWLKCRTVLVLFVAMETETRTSAIITKEILPLIKLEEFLGLLI